MAVGQAVDPRATYNYATSDGRNLQWGAAQPPTASRSNVEIVEQSTEVAVEVALTVFAHTVSFV